MKSRMTLILVALTVIMGTLIYLVQDRNNTSNAPPMIAQNTAQPVAIDVAPPPVVRVSTDLADAVPTTKPAVAETAATLTTDSVTSDTPAPDTATTDTATTDSKPLVRVNGDGTLKYVARVGDTLSQLAVAFLGTDSKANRDAVVAANESLQADPDRVLAGHAYSMPLPSASAQPAADLELSSLAEKNGSAKTDSAADRPVAAATSVKEVEDKSVDESKPVEAKTIFDDANGPTLKYTARLGDTVAVLAAQLLGADTKTNRDLIIAANPSLQSDPDKLVAGQTYTIIAVKPLAASATGPHAAVARSNFSSEPDADDAAQLSVARTLRYVAQPGDTVTKLTTTLLGSDTPANRKLILDANPSLKHDPDHIVAGKTYWIAAPTADSIP